MNIKAKKSLGQNFLSNPKILDRMLVAGEISKDDTVLEIGPGLGTLTQKLSEKAGRVIAIEKDRRLIETLREKFKNSNVEIIENDILELDIKKLNLGNNDFKVIGNIPYYITSHLVRVIFEKWPQPKLIVLMLQKEVAQRITAKAPDMNLLALSVQYYSEPKIEGYVAKGNFRPIPKVDSAIIKLSPRPDATDAKQKGLFFNLAKAGFSGKRKQLAGNLSKHLKISKNEISSVLKELNLKETSRAEELSLSNWLYMVKKILPYYNLK